MDKIKVLILWLGVLLISCTPARAPVVDQSSAYGDTPAVHIARENENLFLVAMKYNLDYQQLARNNGLSYPYKLQAGQRVNLKSSRGNLPDQQKPVVVIARNEDKPSTQTPVEPVVEKPVTTNKQKTVAGIKWQWPIKGKLIKTYAASPDNYKGIDIKASSGASVRAAADGVVVYVGDGLAKYGNLIIVSHKDIYLSAYAQLRKVLADEGQTVRAGEKIATLGSRPLHFEIRKDADTVDPQALLP